MARQPRILIAGASGVFGRLLTQELLATTTAQLVLAGRDLGRVSSACEAVADRSRVQPLALDLSSPAALRSAAMNCFAVACTAGPFQEMPHALPRAALDAGAHWLDIADDPGWVLPLLADRALSAAAAGAGVAVMPGASTVPALSGALVRLCCAQLTGGRTALVTLFIGNRNAKGAAAIASVLSAGLGDARPVELPIGRRTAYRLPSPDATLLRNELGLKAEFQVSFELELSNRLMAALGPLARRLSPSGSSRLAHALSVAGARMSWLGSDTGCLQAKLWADSGQQARAAFVSASQRLAILPCALALQALLDGELEQRGVVHPSTWLVPDEWVRRLATRNVRFVSVVA